ncbi:MAG: hypothetical protein ACREDQ_07175 [Limisphaerales bacterium]
MHPAPNQTTPHPVAGQWTNTDDRPPCCWQSTPLPETDGYKHGRMLRGKIKIWFSGNGRYGCQPVILRARRIEPDFNSVFLPPFERMAAMTCERFRLSVCPWMFENIRHVPGGFAGDFHSTAAENQHELARVKEIEHGLAGEVFDWDTIQRLGPLRV